MQRTIILLTGTPGAGKSTVAEALSKRNDDVYAVKTLDRQICME